MKNRSRINTFLLAILSTVLITLSGCSEDFFNKQAGDRITPDQHYKTTTDFVVSSDGAISSLQEAMPKLIMVDGLRSDAMDVTSYAGADLSNINDHVFLPGNPYTDPSDLYKVIVNLNELLAHIDEIEKYCALHPDTRAMVIVQDEDTQKDKILHFGPWKDISDFKSDILEG